MKNLILGAIGVAFFGVVAVRILGYFIAVFTNHGATLTRGTDYA